MQALERAFDILYVFTVVEAWNEGQQPHEMPNPLHLTFKVY